MDHLVSSNFLSKTPLYFVGVLLFAMCYMSCTDRNKDFTSLISTSCSVVDSVFIDQSDDPFIVDPENRIIQVVEYYSPTCSFCKDFEREFQLLNDIHVSRATFHYRPFMLGHSDIFLYNIIYQSQKLDFHDDFAAILLADTSNKLDGNVALSMLLENKPLDEEVILQLQNGLYDDLVYTDRTKLQAAGITETPLITVNGYLLDDYQELGSCLERLSSIKID